MKRNPLIFFQAFLLLSIFLFSSNLVIETESALISCYLNEIFPLEPPFINTRMSNKIEETKVSSQEYNYQYKSLEITQTSYENHSLIVIDGNEDFHAQAEAENWPGTGTLANPYIINGYFIEGDKHTSVNHISNTDVHFRISNCLIESRFELNNVKNGHVFNNTIQYLLWLTDSDHNNITNNILTNEGYYLYRYNKIWPIYLSRSNHNEISNHFVIGIGLSDSANNTLLNNTLSYLELVNSGSNRIIDNKFYTDNPISISGSKITDFLQTEVINNTMNGKPLLYWENISGENLPNGLGGIVLINCKNITITNQTLFGGVYAFCSNLEIHNNTLLGGDYAFCSNSKFQNNTFLDTSLDLYNSDSITVASNIFENSSISLYNTNNSILIENIRNSSFVTKTSILTFGIRISSSENVSLIKNSVTGIINGIIQRSGVSIGEVSNILILNNTIGPIIHEAPHLFDDAQPRGISLGSFSNATIIGNTFVGNYKGLSVFNCTSESKVLYNNFIENYKHVTEAKCGLRVLFAYNFYDNWRSPDVDEDGIVDDPYLVFDDIFDYFPLVDPVTDISSFFPLPPRVIRPNRKDVSISDPLLISWLPALDLHGPSISYSVFYDVVDDPLDWILIAAQLKETEYLWDLNSTLQPGMVFRIKVEAVFYEGLTVEFITDEYVIVEYSSNATSILIGPILGVIIIYAMRRRKKKRYKFESIKINELFLRDNLLIKM